MTYWRSYVHEQYKKIFNCNTAMFWDYGYYPLARRRETENVWIQ